MTEFREISSEFLAQSDLEVGDALKSEVSENCSVLLGQTAKGQFKSLSLVKRQGGEPRSAAQLEALLRLSFDGYLSTNMIGSVSFDDECAVTRIYFKGLDSASALESDLNDMDAILNQETDADSGRDAELDFNQSNSDWIQV